MTGKPDLVLESRQRPERVLPDLGAPAEANEAVRAAIARNRDEIVRRKTQAEAEDTGPPEIPPEQQAIVREDVESVVIALEDGTPCKIVQAKNLTYRLAVLLANDPGAQGIEPIARALLCVREIGGHEPPVVRNKVDLLAWMEKLGDDNIERISATYRIHWPPLLVTDLRVLKKTVKTPSS
jgi:hypothetical protein